MPKLECTSLRAKERARRDRVVASRRECKAREKWGGEKRTFGDPARNASSYVRSCGDYLVNWRLVRCLQTFPGYSNPLKTKAVCFVKFRTKGEFAFLHIKSCFCDVPPALKVELTVTFKRRGND